MLLHSSLIFLVIFPIFVVFPASSIEKEPFYNYYWRDYCGSIPRDAVCGGERIYIGQVYHRSRGLIVVQITPGLQEVFDPMFPQTLTKHIKILCGPRSKIYWMRTTGNEVRGNVQKKHAVRGGHVDGLGNINIGRVSQGDEVKIGPVFVENGTFYWNSNNNRDEVSDEVSFEILMYDTRGAN